MKDLSRMGYYHTLIVLWLTILSYSSFIIAELRLIVIHIQTLAMQPISLRYTEFDIDA